MLLDNDEINLYYNFEMKISKKKKLSNPNKMELICSSEETPYQATMRIRVFGIQPQ